MKCERSLQEVHKVKLQEMTHVRKLQLVVKVLKTYSPWKFSTSPWTGPLVKVYLDRPLGKTPEKCFIGRLIDKLLGGPLKNFTWEGSLGSSLGALPFKAILEGSLGRPPRKAPQEGPIRRSPGRAPRLLSGPWEAPQEGLPGKSPQEAHREGPLGRPPRKAPRKAARKATWEGSLSIIWPEGPLGRLP